MDQKILENFPKKRAELPPEYLSIYETHYKKNRQGATTMTSLSMKLERWLHIKVAEDVQEERNSNLATLEIGAGMLNQLPFEPKVLKYDIVEPFETLFSGSADLARVRNIYPDIAVIPDGTTYDRITSVAAFEHILNLPEVVARAVTLLKSSGTLRAAIPNEGTILWKIGTYITGYEFQRLYNLNYQALMRYEHVNTADEIEAVLKYFFRTTSASVFGISKRFAFYRFIRCTGPDAGKARQYLGNLQGK